MTNQPATTATAQPCKPWLAGRVWVSGHLLRAWWLYTFGPLWPGGETHKHVIQSITGALGTLLTRGPRS